MQSSLPSLRPLPCPPAQGINRGLSPIIVIREQKLSGDSLYERLYRKITATDENIRFPDQVGGCFIKGTRVHTKDGLKPIEEIKVGDYVLSSPEDGSGKPEYKQVVNTFMYKNKTIRHVEYCRPDGKVTFVAATGNHPFWVEGVGWTRADQLRRGYNIRFADDSLGEIKDQYPVYKFRDDEFWEIIGDRPRLNFWIIFNAIISSFLASLAMPPARGINRGLSPIIRNRGTCSE